MSNYSTTQYTVSGRRLVAAFFVIVALTIALLVLAVTFTIIALDTGATHHIIGMFGGWIIAGIMTVVTGRIILDFIDHMRG